MARSEIIEKLDSFLSKHNPLTEECHAVYLMVEIRKILDQVNNIDFPLLRFYCDWIVHARKDKITKEIKKVMEKINEGIPKDRVLLSRFLALYGSEVIKFIYMKSLKKELRSFLKCFNLPKRIVATGKNWRQFVNLLTKILANQPIIDPIKEIKYFAFKPATGGLVSCIIQFKDQRNQCKFTDFMVF